MFTIGSLKSIKSINSRTNFNFWCKISTIRLFVAWKFNESSVNSLKVESLEYQDNLTWKEFTKIIAK